MPLNRGTHNMKITVNFRRKVPGKHLDDGVGCSLFLSKWMGFSFQWILICSETGLWNPVVIEKGILSSVSKESRTRQFDHGDRSDEGEYRSLWFCAPWLKCFNNDEVSLTWLIILGWQKAEQIVLLECLRYCDMDDTSEHTFFCRLVLHQLCVFVEDYMGRML